MSITSIWRGLTWYESYNCHQCEIAGGAIKMNVNWTDGGYAVSVNNRKLKNKVPDVYLAKNAAYQLAEKILNEATDDLQKTRE